MIPTSSYQFDRTDPILHLRNELQRIQSSGRPVTDQTHHNVKGLYIQAALEVFMQAGLDPVQVSVRTDFVDGVLRCVLDDTQLDDARFHALVTAGLIQVNV